MYHGSKPEITGRFNSLTSMVLPHDHKGKSDIVVEMSPITRTKVFPAHTGSLTNLGEFAVLVYYEVMKLTPSYYRIDLAFE